MNSISYIIFDLEATCWDQWDKSQNETIEIGAVKINYHGEILSEFNAFIRPIRYPKLSQFCINLTGIQQDEIDKAAYFSEVIEAFKSWIGVDRQDYCLCSWGYYDRIQFESDCKLHGISSEWVSKHISLKHQYPIFKNLKRAIGMKNALIEEGMKLTGAHHRGIDDARNIAKIFLKYLNKWNFEDN